MNAAPLGKPVRMRVGVPAVLAFGSNLGDRAVTIRDAVDLLGAEPGVDVRAVSRLYETPALKPEGIDEEAPAYLNAVALVHTLLEPLDLLGLVNAVEDRLGRVREERWGDRTLDLDLIAYGDFHSSEEHLQVPHPRAAERLFVLEPWLSLDPDAVLPGAGRVDELVRRLKDEP